MTRRCVKGLQMTVQHNPKKLDSTHKSTTKLSTYRVMNIQINKYETLNNRKSAGNIRVKKNDIRLIVFHKSEKKCLQLLSQRYIHDWTHIKAKIPKKVYGNS